MEVTGHATVKGAVPIRQVSKSGPPTKSPTGPSVPKDDLDISDVGKKLETLNQLTDVRDVRLAQIKAAIEAGEYETPDKLEFAVDRLLDAIRAENRST